MPFTYVAPTLPSEIDRLTPTQRLIVEQAFVMATELESAVDSTPEGQAIGRCESFLPGEVSRIVRVYRDRWTGTFHRDDKRPFGLGDCQRRDVQDQTRHMYLVMLAYSLLMGALRQGRANERALHRLMTIGDACGAMSRKALRTTFSWPFE